MNTPNWPLIRMGLLIALAGLLNLVLWIAVKGITVDIFEGVLSGFTFALSLFVCLYLARFRR